MSIPAEPTGQCGALVGASSSCNRVWSAFIIEIENPERNIILIMNNTSKKGCPSMQKALRFARIGGGPFIVRNISSTFVDRLLSQLKLVTFRSQRSDLTVAIKAHPQWTVFKWELLFTPKDFGNAFPKANKKMLWIYGGKK